MYLSGAFTMATTNNNQNESVNSQYAAVAKYAGEVYQTMIAAPADEVRMTAAQVAKGIYKSVFFTCANGEENEQHTIEAPGMTLTTTPRMVFGQLAELESMLKIKKADRMTFAHTYELLKAEQVQASCFIPTDIAMLCKYADTSDLRPVMNGVCFDFDQPAIVSSNGHVLVAVPMNAGAGTGRWIVPQKFLEAHAGGIIQFAEIDGIQYAYVCQERTRLIEGRYPNWQCVIPKCDTAPIHIGSAWKEFVQKCCMLGKVNEASGMIIVSGRSYSKTITIIGRNDDFGTEQRAEVCIDGEIPYDFCIGMKGEFFKSYPPFTDMYLHDLSRAALFTDGVCVMIQMPMLVTDDQGNATGVTTGWAPTPIKEEFVPSVLKKPEPKQDDKPAEAQPVCDAPEKPKAQKPKAKKPTKKVEDKVVVCSVPKEEKPDVKPETTEAAPATPETPTETVCSTAMAMINGKWEPVEEMTRTNGRIMVRRLNQPGQRAIVQIADFRPAGAKIEQPVCEAPEKPAPAEVSSVTPETPATPAESTEAEGITIAPYSEKSFYVKGDTRKWRKQLRKYGAWIGAKEIWVFSNKRREYVEKLVGVKLAA